MAVWLVRLWRLTDFALEKLSRVLKMGGRKVRFLLVTVCRFELVFMAVPSNSVYLVMCQLSIGCTLPSNEL